MTYLVVLAALALLPVLAILLLRVNGAVAFMSLCLGSVLVAYTSNDVTDLITSFSAHGTLDVRQWVQLALLVAPFVVAILFARGSVSGHKSLTNLLPALAAGLLFALLTVPLLPLGTGREIQQVEVWRQLSDLQTMIVLSGAVFSLIFLLFTHRAHGDESGKHGH